MSGREHRFKSHRAFWLYWGDSALDAVYGTLCFGNIELKKHTLIVSALSDVRMKTLLDLISPLNLPAPRLEQDHIPYPEKTVRPFPFFRRKCQRKS